MRVKANYTFDKDVKKEFDLLCKEKSINKSALIEKWLKKFIEESKNSQ